MASLHFTNLFLIHALFRNEVNFYSFAKTHIKFVSVNPVGTGLFSLVVALAGGGGGVLPPSIKFDPDIGHLTRCSTKYANLNYYMKNY